LVYNFVNKKEEQEDFASKWGIEMVDETPETTAPVTIDKKEAKNANLDDLMNQLNNL
jgi:hypothetical protein